MDMPRDEESWKKYVAESLRGLGEELKNNSAHTAEIQKALVQHVAKTDLMAAKISGVVAAFDAVTGALKVLEMLSKLAKYVLPVLLVVAIITGWWTTLTHFVKGIFDAKS